MELTVWDSPEDIGLTFTATCQDGLSYPGLRKCGDLKIGDTVSLPFNLSPGEAVSASVQTLTTQWVVLGNKIQLCLSSSALLTPCHVNKATESGFARIGYGWYRSAQGQLWGKREYRHLVYSTLSQKVLIRQQDAIVKNGLFFPVIPDIHVMLSPVKFLFLWSAGLFLVH